MIRRLVLVAACFAVLAAFTLAGCDDSTKTIIEPEPTGTVTFNFDNYVGTTPITLGTSLDYTNPQGTRYSISLLLYDISDLVLHRTDGQTFGMDGIHYRDQAEPATRSLTLANVPKGTYDMVSFTFGLNAEKNVYNKYKDYPFNFENVMAWPEVMGGGLDKLGYHYMRMEGNFEDTPGGATVGYTTHTGARWFGDANPLMIPADPFPIHHFFQIYIPITATKIDGGSWEITIRMDANGWYEDPTPGDGYDSDYDWHDVQGTPMGQGIMGNLPIQDKLMTNGPHCFTATVQAAP